MSDRTPQGRGSAPNGAHATDAAHADDADQAERWARLQTAVAGLAREVEAMRRAMRQVPTAGDLARLAATVAELSETTAAMQAASGRQSEPDPVPSWLTLAHDLHSARAVLADLTGWLGDVYLRYGDAARDFPECWLWHPEIVEELVWLMYAWLGAYRDDRDDGGAVRAVGDWHDRLRPGVVHRLHSYAKACSLENHLPGRPRATGAPQVPVIDGDPTAAEAITTWWSQRRDQPGPTPTHDQMTTAAAAARQARTGTTGTTDSTDRTHSAGGTPTPGVPR